MRIFSDIKVRNGPDANGMYSITRIPIIYGDPSYLVAQIIKGNSENTLLPSPMFSAWIESIKMAPARRQDSQFVGKVSTIEREFKEGAYTENAGVRYDVERYMPVPYDVYFKLDVWTTNTTNKLQIFEQLGVIFNPSIQLQQNSNIMDWTSIFEVWLEDVQWTNRSIPQGDSLERDVMSYRFKVPVWINPPAKVKKSNLVAEIVTNVFNDLDVHSLESHLNGEYDIFRTCYDSVPTQMITTQGNHKISVSNNNGIDEITLLNSNGGDTPIQNWQELINIYGQIVPDITKIRLKLNPDIDISDSDIIGNIEQDLTRPNVLIFTPDIDTLPASTIPPILSIIDPTEVSPGHGLPSAVGGQRYLLTSPTASDQPILPLGVTTSPWGAGLVAYPNDIIEFNGINWTVIFDSRNSTGHNYVVNNANSSQYMFNGIEWSYTYYGTYAPGYWRVDNIIKNADGTTNIYE